MSKPSLLRYWAATPVTALHIPPHFPALLRLQVVETSFVQTRATKKPGEGPHHTLLQCGTDAHAVKGHAENNAASIDATCCQGSAQTTTGLRPVILLVGREICRNVVTGYHPRNRGTALREHEFLIDLWLAS